MRLCERVLIGIGIGTDKIIRINFSDLCGNKVFDI